ncbi:hypothetical protein CGCSCA4_v003075 [Colletotrichum siamense]|uniref:Uncharacterized protein n=1 Tax=Colletotrichum siamense TaxID=690259 RepID=A0A9P5BNV9_COLSI|nr:uncharacterized protein CGCS363_v003822 [Colletotrichum siamense]KAF4844197.1 hypothetical protein CGCSCA2_v014007 [Colletotrichum siamense]KAF4851682.1 hypothetical protein CGCSCA4_v003075 [Colletotrichum siamense]KAF5511535.1 hypothetical protein CGCS363_v003822 [Colletotrichum siamense]
MARFTPCSVAPFTLQVPLSCHLHPIQARDHLKPKPQQQLFSWIIILRIPGYQRHTVLATQQALSSGSVQAAASSEHLVLCQWPRPQKTACKVV